MIVRVLVLDLAIAHDQACDLEHRFGHQAMCPYDDRAVDWPPNRLSASPLQQELRRPDRLLILLRWKRAGIGPIQEGRIACAA